MKSFEKLLLENKAWAEEVCERDPAISSVSRPIRSPNLWIGCS